MAGHPQTRRAFLSSLSLSLLGLAGLWRFLTPLRAPAAKPVEVPLADVPRGGALVLADEGIAVTRTAGDDVAVLSLACPHLGCRVRATETGFQCPCHGSGFDRDGRRLQGPARTHLRRVPFVRDQQLLRIEA